MENVALLVGNGINNIEQKYTWDDLIDEIIESTGASGQIDKTNKPFPLLYEQIYAEATQKRNHSEVEIKRIVSEKTMNLKKNDIHEEIIKIGCKNILTTNYDFTFEQCLCDDVHILKNNANSDEDKYSLYRHYKFKDVNIWHINGDAKKPKSILLGFEHYADYLQKMKSYIESGSKNSHSKRKSSIRRMTDNNISYRSWLDYFLKYDIYIFGLTLDYAEIHLWWLLAYRLRAKVENTIPIDNKIIFYYPLPWEDKRGIKVNNDKTELIKSRINLMGSLGVNAISVKFVENNERQYYKEILKKIVKNVKSSCVKLP